MKKVCVVTGTRAEYGLLKPLIRRLNDDEEIKLCFVACGMHLSPEFGLTYQEIEEDGYTIHEKNEMLLSSDTPNGITKSIGIGMMGFAEIFTRQQPDMLVLLGDRFECFAAATAALVHRIPIAHIHGGELTEGAIDDAFRHSITKMSVLHFTSTEEYRQRVIQMGESPDRVYNVGALGIENVKSLKLLSQKELEERINFKFDGPVAIVTFHPVTLEGQNSEKQFLALLNVLSQEKNLKCIFTKANADTEGRIINKMIDEYVLKHNESSISFYSMGQLNYLSALQYAEFVIGNSSSGIIEVPSFGIATIDIGDRQKGRVRAESVIHCEPQERELKEAVYKARQIKEQRKMYDNYNPYEKEDTAGNIIKHIKNALNNRINVKKCFYDM